MIKSVASTVSRKTKSRGAQPPAHPRCAVACGVPWILVFLEAALAADLVTILDFQGVQVGCSGGRPDDGFKNAKIVKNDFSQKSVFAGNNNQRPHRRNNAQN